MLHPRRLVVVQVEVLVLVRVLVVSEVKQAVFNQ